MTANSATLESTNNPPAPPRKARRDSEGWVYLVLGLVTASAWWVSSLRLFTSKSDFGYWLGVAGGSTMLLVFAYPMRKHLRFMQRWGAGRYWFIVHMMVGVVGPTMILLHANFSIGSVNAGVALLSMVVVALSGVVGRFLYVRVHRDLAGQKLTLAELRKHVVGQETDVARLRFAPAVQKTLAEFEAYALAESISLPQLASRSMALGWRHWAAQRRCRGELRLRLAAVAHAEGWSRGDFRRRLRVARRLVNNYLSTVHRIALFAAWERLFALWHVVHVPFVYLMVLSAVVHVIAVHAY